MNVLVQQVVPQIYSILVNIQWLSYDYPLMPLWLKQPYRKGLLKLVSLNKCWVSEVVFHMIIISRPSGHAGQN